MLKKSITYINPFTDEQVTEDHYFHISKADLVELQMENLNEPTVTDPETGAKLEGFPAKLQAISDSKDGVAILAIVKDMIRRSYGKKDGDRFLRNQEIWETFSSGEAYSQLYFELCTDAEAQAQFMNGIFPSDMLAEVTRLAAQAPEIAVAKQAQAEHEAKADPTGLTTAVTPRVLTQAEVVAMDSDELKSGLATGKYKLS